MQTFLDMRTVFSCAALVAGAFALLLLGIMRTRKPYPGYGDWAAAEAAFTVIFLWQAFRDHLNGGIPVVLGNLTVCCALVLLARGMRKFCGCRFSAVPVYSAAALYLCLILYFFFVHESFWARTLLAGIYSAAMALYAAAPFLRKAPAGRQFGCAVIQCSG